MFSASIIDFERKTDEFVPIHSIIRRVLKSGLSFKKVSAAHLSHVKACYFKEVFLKPGPSLRTFLSSKFAIKNLLVIEFAIIYRPSIKKSANKRNLERSFYFNFYKFSGRSANKQTS